MAQSIKFKIDAQGDAIFLVSDSTKAFIPEHAVVRRASHVEPISIPLRLAFRALRGAFGDESAIAEWTRTWKCWWLVNLSPVGFKDCVHFRTRAAAIEWEIEFLNKNFLAVK